MSNSPKHVHVPDMNGFIAACIAMCILLAILQNYPASVTLP